jgi:predicted nucleic acid-binding protein
MSSASRVVLDASACAAWVMPDEMNAAANRVFAQACIDEGVFHAPLLWHWEMGSILSLAETRQRIPSGAAQLALQTLYQTKIKFDVAPSLHRMEQIMRQAKAHDLSFYDASYLELVLRLNGQLATKDKKLIQAAKTCGVAIFDF